jgi:uncharacterized protein YndB with AHSA1/START domain
MGRWWPRSHSIGGSPLADVIVEPRAGGRWYATLEDGSENEWGKVLAWEPPARAVLAWQITADWKFDPDFLTEVEIRFQPLPGGGTEVELEHRKLENYGARAEEVARMIGEPGGWNAILGSFAALVDATE